MTLVQFIDNKIAAYQRLIDRNEKLERTETLEWNRAYTIGEKSALETLKAHLPELTPNVTLYEMQEFCRNRNCWIGECPLSTSPNSCPMGTAEDWNIPEIERVVREKEEDSDSTT